MTSFKYDQIAGNKDSDSRAVRDPIVESLEFLRCQNFDCWSPDCAIWERDD